MFEEGATNSGIYAINPRDGGGVFNAYCDMSLDVANKQGWMVIQRRVDEAADFNRSYNDYYYGFGDLTKNFWLGFESIKRALDGAEDRHTLYVAVMITNQSIAWASWDTFSLGSRSTDWELSVSGFTSSPGVNNFLAASVDRKFSTYDRNPQNNCDQQGWWLEDSNCANLNGIYDGTNGVTGPNAEQLVTIVMAIRPN